MTLYIIRHGNTFEAGEAPRRIGARTDLPLVESGRAQARALGAWFAEQAIYFDAMMVSPLLRARETAALVLQRQPEAAAVEVCDWLNEIDHGPDEDQPEDIVLARIGEAALAAWEHNATAPPGWIVDGENRRAAWRKLFRNHRAAPERTIAIVTSNGTARFALLAEQALREQAAELPSLKLRTGAWGRIEMEGDVIRLETWNSRP